MRKYKRSIARAKMKAEGIRRMNKIRHTTDPITHKPVVLPSYFAENWRKYC